ncbi:hypothetical protein P43SY_008391 [Pythium insidiosum]|uniref:Cation efflux protein cytoplasmic domain-containing protein n=1 Tax=Pythium insidiosum TaxID=114742 RepID=A0AAD5Q8J1_PYTIN|nr:hypothetical protein P43SY_008391 [Pythium insidiosum]
MRSTALLAMIRRPAWRGRAAAAVAHGHSHSHSHGARADDGELSDDDARAANRIAWAGVYLNVALCVAGVAFHSSGLLADAVHSASDLASDGVTLLALRYCARPPDALQPYGYGKYETIGTLSVATLLVGGSLGIMHHSLDTLVQVMAPAMADVAAVDAKLAALALDADVREAVQELVPHSHSHGHHHHVTLHPAALAIAAAAVASKEALYRATTAVGRRINSSVLIASAWHHRSDAVASVVAMAGIGLSLVGMPMFDPIAGMLVGGIILKMGGQIGWDAERDLCDAQLAPQVVQELHDAVEAVVRASQGELRGVKSLRSRKIGRQLHVDLTLVVSDRHGVSFERACEWKRQVKHAIQRDVPRVKDIIVELTTPAEPATTVIEACEQSHRQHS